jgi:hypothetical protein
MEHRGVRYAIRQGIAPGQWCVAIYPQGDGMPKEKTVFGTREEAEATARSMINALLKKPSALKTPATPGRPGRPIAGYPGYGWRGAAYGVAAGAAAAGAYGLYNYYNNYNNGCYSDTYGHWVCPSSQYPYYR